MDSEKPSATISRNESVKKYTPSMSSRRKPGPRSHKKVTSIHHSAPCFWTPFSNGETVLDGYIKTPSSRRKPGPRNHRKVNSIHYFAPRFWAPFFNGVTVFVGNKNTLSSRRKPGPRSSLTRMLTPFEITTAVFFNIASKARHT
jgi:hypothetical protein